MTEIKQSIIIDAPVNKVFEYASDYLKWSESASKFGVKVDDGATYADLQCKDIVCT